MTPFQYQLDALAKLHASPSKSLLVQHGTGSGKTLTALLASKDASGTVLYVGPSATQEQVLKEKKKSNVKVDLSTITYEKLVRNPNLINELNPSFIILDEAQRFRNPTTKLRKLFYGINQPKILLSATPVVNRPEDIASLINITANKEVLPENPKKFRELFIGSEEIKPNLFGKLMGIKPGEREYIKNTAYLQKVVAPYIDKHMQKDPTEFPSITQRVIHVLQSKEQKELSEYYTNKLPFWMRYKIEHKLPPAKQEVSKMMSYLNATRQLSNTTQSFDPTSAESPKIHTILSELKKATASPNAKALVYSNYLDSGILNLANQLKKENIKFSLLTGKEKNKSKSITDYNSGKTPILLLSGAGSEGIDLKGTRLVQIMEPHWNENRINQVIGRAARVGSHTNLPLAERKVEVQKFVTNSSTDEYMYDYAAKKQQLIDQLNKIL